MNMITSVWDGLFEKGHHDVCEKRKVYRLQKFGSKPEDSVPSDNKKGRFRRAVELELPEEKLPDEELFNFDMGALMGDFKLMVDEELGIAGLYFIGSHQVTSLIVSLIFKEGCG